MPDLTWNGLFTTENAVALVTLGALEIVLGIDNIVFISILTGKLPEHQRAAARRTGLFVAMFARLALLLSIKWIMGLKTVLFTVPDFGVLPKPLEMTGKGLILLGGGLFLVAKATLEIHHKIEGHESAAGKTPDPDRTFQKGAASFASIIAQILLIDLVFSLDSVITAVGMAKRVEVMMAAVVIAVGVMLAAVNVISNFVERHPTIKMLALSFLVLIGVTLIGESFDQKIPKGYTYFAMAFSLGVEMLNIRLRRPGTATGRAAS